MPDNPAPAPGFAAALAVWLRIGVTSVGGPAAQIGLLHETLVVRRRWISESDFDTALNFCMLLPGPEAQQLATYLGWRLHGIRGAIAGGGLFVLPGALLMAGLSWLSASHAGTAWLKGALTGTLPVVAVLVTLAVVRMARRNLGSPLSLGLAGLALLGLVALHLPFVLILAIAAIVGLLNGAWTRRHGPSLPERSRTPDAPCADTAGGALRWPSLLRRTAGLTVAFGLLWAAPVVFAVACLGRAPYLDVATVFTEAAFVTFGGAYAVIPFVASLAVDQHHWITQADMVHGLALAETLPGPLILTNQYVGYLAGWNAAASGHAGGLGPAAAAAVTAALASWMTFLPCFYFVLCGAPVMEGLRRDGHIRAAMTGVTSAVVGVIAALGLTVAQAAFWPEGRIDPAALLVAVGAGLALGPARVPTLVAVLAAAALGAVRAGYP